MQEVTQTVLKAVKQAGVRAIVSEGAQTLHLVFPTAVITPPHFSIAGYTKLLCFSLFLSTYVQGR